MLGLSIFSLHFTNYILFQVLSLLKARKIVQQNMKQSGTHKSSPWSFIPAAVNKVSHIPSINQYAFFIGSSPVTVTEKLTQTSKRC